MTQKNPLSQYPQFVVDYSQRLHNLQSWVDNADKLLEAAKVLEPRLRDFWNVVQTNAKEGRYNKGGEPPYIPPPDLHGPYFILVSYALENFFKALIIRDRGDEIDNQFLQTGRLPRLIKEHDLAKLAKRAKVKIDIKEEDTLTRLSRFSRWKSRYPVPVEISDMQNIIKYSDGKGYFTDYFKPDDLDQVNAIINRVKDHLKGTRRKESKRGEAPLQ